MSMDKGIAAPPVVGFANDYTFVDYFRDRIPRALVLAQGISVIVPFYEKLEEIKLVIKGLAIQTISPINIELIICDDGSTAATREELEQFLKGYELLFRSVRLLTQERGALDSVVLEIWA